MKYSFVEELTTFKVGGVNYDLNGKSSITNPSDPNFYTDNAASINGKYNNIYSNLNTYGKLNINNDKSDAIDNSGNLIYIYDNNNPSPNTKDVLLQDNNDILVQQNIMYIIGMITTATLIVSAIIISRR